MGEVLSVARQAEVAKALRQFLPARAVLYEEEDTRPYECDGLTAYRQLPMVVALPETEGHDQARDWLSGNVAADFDAGEDLPVFEHVFSHYRLHIEPRRWRLADANLLKGDNDDLRWQPRQQLHELGLPAPVKKLLGNPP